MSTETTPTGLKEIGDALNQVDDVFYTYVLAALLIAVGL